MRVWHQSALLPKLPVDSQPAIENYLESAPWIRKRLLLGRYEDGSYEPEWLYPDSPEHDSFSDGLLEHAVYTRPRVFRGRAVPDVLLSGNHQEIARYRAREARRITSERRPDLLARVARTEGGRETPGE